MALWLKGLHSLEPCVWGGLGEAVCAQTPAPACCRDVSSVEVLMNYHQGLKTELEARVPELTACQELGRSLLLNKSAMADEVGKGAGDSPLLSVSAGVGATFDASPTYPPRPDPGTAGQAGNQEGGSVGQVGPSLGVAAAE